MPSHSAALLRHLHRLAELPPSDAELLGCWVRQRDEDAFSAIVARHGPMVFGTCWRVLGGTQDAEDAFQAVFLLLSCKAHTLHRPEALAGWLHGVAVRLARKARTAAVRRQSAESCPPDREPLDPHPDPLDLLSARELLALIDEEIGRLPEVYRLPLVLCDLEGRTQEEAAGVLGWTHGSIRGRLLRGRERLKTRLRRRGLAPVVLSAVLTSGLTRGMADAAVPAALAARVSRAAVPFSVSTSADGVSAAAAALAREGLRGMMLSKVKLETAVLLTVCVFATGAGLLARQALSSRPAEDPSTLPVIEFDVPMRNAGSNGKAEVGRDQDGEPLPAEALSRLGTTRFRHGGLISSLTFTLDGKSLVSFGEDGVRLWDVATGKERPRPIEEKLGRGFALSPDGKWLAVLVSTTNQQDKTIAIYEFATGRVMRRFGKQAGFGSLHFSPDGKILAAYHWQSEIELWDPSAGHLLHALKGHTDFVWSVAFSADSKTLVSGGDDKTIRFWNVATGKQRRRFDLPEKVSHLALSPDAKQLVSIHQIKLSGEGWAQWVPGPRASLWDVASGKETHQLVMPAKDIWPGVPGGFFQVKFAPDGKTVLTGGHDGVLRIWETATGREVRRYSGFVGAPRDFALARDGKTVAALDGNTALRLIDFASGMDRIATSGHRGGVSSVLVTPDCQSIVTRSWDKLLLFWDPATGRERLRRTIPEDYGYIGGISSDGKTYVTADGEKTVRLHDLTTGEERAVLRGIDANSPFALSPDRKTLASVSGKTVCLLDPATGKERRTLMEIDTGVSGMSFTSDGRRLVVWSNDRAITTWDTATGRKLRPFAGPPEPGPPPVNPSSFASYTAVLSPNDKLLALGLQDRFLPLMNVETGQEIRRFAVAEDGVSSLAFSPDGKSLAWGGWREGTVYIGEIATGRQRHHFTGHRGRILSLAFSRDGKWLISGSDDTSALVWDLTGGLSAKEKGGRPLSAEELKTYWSALAGEDAAAGFRAVQILASDPAHSIPYLGSRLHPVPAVEEMRLTRLISELDNDQFHVREKATTELEKLGETALGALRKALDGQPALETRRRLEQLLEKQEHEQRSPSPQRLRLLRAVEVLERIGDADARRALATLTGGAPGAWLTEDAKAALDRLGRRTSGR
jgi:RNA polymerase sigma factor (sigma-70 family)